MLCTLHDRVIGKAEPNLGIFQVFLQNKRLNWKKVQKPKIYDVYIFKLLFSRNVLMKLLTTTKSYNVKHCSLPIAVIDNHSQFWKYLLRHRTGNGQKIKNFQKRLDRRVFFAKKLKKKFSEGNQILIDKQVKL